MDSKSNWVLSPDVPRFMFAEAHFEADSAPTSIGFTLGSDNYVGTQWSVNLRLHVSKAVGSQTCTADSPAVTVKKVAGVDP